MRRPYPRGSIVQPESSGDAPHPLWTGVTPANKKIGQGSNRRVSSTAGLGADEQDALRRLGVRRGRELGVRQLDRVDAGGGQPVAQGGPARELVEARRDDREAELGARVERLPGRADPLDEEEALALATPSLAQPGEQPLLGTAQRHTRIRSVGWAP